MIYTITISLLIEKPFLFVETTKLFISNSVKSLKIHLGPVYTGPDKFGTDPRLGSNRPCVHTGPPGTGTIWIHLPGAMWVQLRKGSSTDLDRSRSRINGQDRSHFGSVSLCTLSNRSVHAVAGSYSSLISA